MLFLTQSYTVIDLTSHVIQVKNETNGEKAASDVWETQFNIDYVLRNSTIV